MVDINFEHFNVLVKLEFFKENDGFHYFSTPDIFTTFEIRPLVNIVDIIETDIFSI